ncbi:FtsW/RodA/SpoVE family cell cycle protein [Campylobacter ureolyticus]|uniref:FtsW/RodA/SpoVE family cell cycle protein n=1 Tax=Campylobacter ureolyticus TaxID=827 RepID=UPI0022B41F71|nr:FtsW/RodA/SpoVE family cell cycle protein [Campylobacter ureolyticus]MCZ6116366.1 FtsW/RodA/SpoVE family cell cycle protein [Campylobacter ureolyticus]
MKSDKFLFFIASFLIATGIIFSLSLGVFSVLLYDYDNTHFFIRQLSIGIISIFLMWALSRLNPEKILTFVCIYIFFLAMFCLMLAMPFMPSSLVREVNGAARWIKLPGFSFAPVEFFKIGFIYFLAWSFTRKLDGTKKYFLKEIGILFPYVVVFGIVILIIGSIQNDFGQVVVLASVLFAMIILAGVSGKIIGLILSFFALAGFLLITSSQHRISRIHSWWSGIQDVVISFLPSEMGNKLYIDDAQTPYQISHSLNAINNGGFFGEGFGLGTFKLGFLSEVHTDFVLAGISEEVGFFGILIIVILFYALLLRIFQTASKTSNKVYYLFSSGIGFMFLFSFMINSYGITSITPVKGIAVPFLSYGGSQLLGSSVAIGCILMISKRSKI